MKEQLAFSDIPFNDIVRFGQATMLDDTLFSISWILGRFCNYKCSYCWPYARNDTPDHQELETYLKTIDEIKRQARQNGFNKFHWSFSGGEPTAYKHLLELVKHVDDGPGTPYQSIHMTTNLSPSRRWWKNYAEITSMLQRRSITASFHDEFAKEIEFGDKILQLTEDDVFVTINQVMVPSKFYELYERLCRFAARGINVTLKPQSDPTASFVVDGYSEDMIKLMRDGFPQHAKNQEVMQVKLIDKDNKVWYMDQAERFNAFGFNKFKGWMCNSGYQGLVIRENEVKRSYSCRDEILGTLDGGFKLFGSPKICITDSCVSSADSKLPKCKSI